MAKTKTLQHSIPGWMANNLKIVDMDGQVRPLSLNIAQRMIHKTIETVQIANGHPVRIIVCKARREGVCLDPQTKILTSDLRWVQLEEIVAGQHILAIDEPTAKGQGNSRKLRRAIVEAKKEIIAPAFRVLLQDGTVLIATAEHRFLVLQKRPNRADGFYRTPLWFQVKDIQVGDCLRQIVRPWHEKQYEDGWMAGIIDGEGSLSYRLDHVARGTRLSIAQKPGDVLDRVIRYFNDKGYNFSQTANKSSGCHHVTICNIADALKLIGSTRPSRFVDNCWWEGKWPPHLNPWTKIVSIESVGIRRMIDLQTSTKTFVAEGYVSHNSTYAEGRFFYEINIRPNVNAIVASADGVSTDKVFRMAKKFQSHMPKAIRRGTDYASKREIVYADPHGSAFAAQTAGTDVLGRAGQNHYFHCLRGDSKLVLWDGSSVFIKDVEIGDIVVDFHGSPAPVIAKFQNGQQEVNRITVWLSNEPVWVTDDHKVLTLDGWNRCDNLTSKSYIALSKIVFSGKINKIKYFLPTRKRPQCGGTTRKTKTTIKLNYDFGYFLGYYLAEGHVSKRWNAEGEYSGLVFGYHKDERHIGKAMKFAKKYATSRSDRVYEGTNRAITTLYGTFLAHLVESVCGRVENKHLPDFLFDSNREFGRGILQGYHDGDGSKTQDDSSVIVTIHERSARQLRRLIMALGYGVAGIGFKKDVYRYDKKVKSTYRVHLNGDTYKNFLADTKDCKNPTNKYKVRNGQYFVRVKEVYPVRDFVDVYDIGVDSELHCFETTVGIVKNCTEFAHWKDAKAQFGGAMQEVPDKNSMVIIESTANGISGAFHDMFWQAMDDWKITKDPSNFLPIFLPWFIFPDYQMKIPQGVKLEIGRPHAPNIPYEWTESEPELIAKYGLCNEQLFWRRWAIKNKCQNDLVLFDQEYPHNSQVAFSASGRNVFSNSKLDKIKISEGQKCILLDGAKPEPVHRSKNCWEVWKEPQAGYEYTIGIDTMEGTQADPDDPKSKYDFHAVSIFCRDTGEIVATYLGQGGQRELGEQCVLAQRWYNGAWIAPELPMGMVVLDILKEAGIDRIYQRQKADEQRVEADSMNLGWRTTIVTRPKMVDNFRTAFNEDEIKFWSNDLVDEMKTFVYDKEGRPKHRPGKHDDLLFAAMIALQLHLRLPFRPDPYPFASTHDGGKIIPQTSLSMSGAVDNWEPGDEDEDGYDEEYTD